MAVVLKGLMWMAEIPYALGLTLSRPYGPWGPVKYDVIFQMPVFCIHMAFRLPQYI